jgi:hypothetical protein
MARVSSSPSTHLRSSCDREDKRSADISTVRLKTREDGPDLLNGGGRESPANNDADSHQCERASKTALSSEPGSNAGAISDQARVVVCRIEQYSHVEAFNIPSL